MAPELASQIRQRRACYHAGRFLSCDRDVVCGTLYVTGPITWLQISSTRSESRQSPVPVASGFPVRARLRQIQGPTVQAASLQREPAQPKPELAVAGVADVVAYQDDHPADGVDAVDDHLAGGRLAVPVVGLLADADHARPVGAVDDHPVGDHLVDAVVSPQTVGDHGLHYAVGLLADADHAHHHLGYHD